MTDIDRAADIDVNRGFAQVTVRVPLTGHVSQEWVSRYKGFAQKWLAHSGNERAFLQAGEGVLEAQDLPDRSYIIVRLPATLDRAVLQSVLNAACELLAETDAAEQVPQAAETEAIVREWWARQ